MYFFTDYRIIAADDGGTAGLQQIVVFITVQVVELGAFGLGNHNREGVVKGQIVLHTAGNDFSCFCDHFLGTGAFLVKIFCFVLFEFVLADRIDRFLDQFIQLSGYIRCVQILIDSKSIVTHGISSLWFVNGSSHLKKIVTLSLVIVNSCFAF